MSITSPWLAYAACWRRLCALEEHPCKYSALETATEKKKRLWCGYCVPHIKSAAGMTVKTEYYKGALWHSPSDLHNVTVWKQTIIQRMEREAQRGETAMIWDAVQSKGMREDIEGERGKKSSERYALSHGWPSGNTGVSLCSGNMTASDAPDGKAWKICKKRGHKCEGL